MTSVLFVHGTGVRREGYESSLKKIRSGFADTTKDRRLVVEGCLWGDALGVKLHAGGRSIPQYQERGGQPLPTDEELEIELWMHLYPDPLYELRVLSITSPPPLRIAPGQKRPSDVLDLHAKRFSITDHLREKLAAGEIDGEFDDARGNILSSPVYSQFIERTPAVMGVFQAALARAFVAEAMAIHRERRGIDAGIQSDALLRNDTVELVRDELGPRQAAVGEWALRKLLGVAKATVGRGAAVVGTSLATWRRGSVTDATSPLAGDILLYQCRGETIRQLIRTRIEELTPPVVLLGHSLGGIACVDLLIDADLRTRVPLLVTVGSQAPFFYEMNALQKLEYGRPLPDHVPRWINIFDLRDLLSYVGETIFPGRVQDVPVDNRQPFPQSHSAYWTNPQTFSTISPGIAQTR